MTAPLFRLFLQDYNILFFIIIFILEHFLLKALQIFVNKRRPPQENIMKSLTESHVNLLGAVMDMQLQRQNVIMSNIANVNTPKYLPRELDFEEELQSALNLDAKGKMAHTDDSHMPATFDANKFEPQWWKHPQLRIAPGEDRVNLDKEMVKMAKNQLQYNALTQITKSSFDGLRQVIQEGSK